MKDIIKYNEAQLENCNGDHTNTNALTDFFSTFWGFLKSTCIYFYSTDRLLYKSAVFCERHFLFLLHCGFSDTCYLCMSEKLQCTVFSR